MIHHYTEVVMRFVRFVALIAALAALVSPARAGTLTFVSSFTTGLSNADGLAFDPATNHVFVSTEGASPKVYEYTRAGGLQAANTITLPGIGGNSEEDVSFLSAAANIGGTVVPAGELIYLNAHYSPDILYAIPHGATGGYDSFVQVAFASSMGGVSYSAARGTFFGADYGANVIREFSGVTGASINTFAAGVNFSGNYSDVEVNPVTGNIFFGAGVTSTFIREFTPTGTQVQDWTLSGISVQGPAGIALDMSRGELWLMPFNSTVVYEFAGLPIAVPEPATSALAAIAATLARIASRRRPA